MKKCHMARGPSVSGRRFAHSSSLFRAGLTERATSFVSPYRTGAPKFKLDAGTFHYARVSLQNPRKLAANSSSAQHQQALRELTRNEPLESLAGFHCTTTRAARVLISPGRIGRRRRRALPFAGSISGVLLFFQTRLKTHKQQQQQQQQLDTSLAIFTT